VHVPICSCPTRTPSIVANLITCSAIAMTALTGTMANVARADEAVESTDQLQEIVVFAQQRSENLQNVPIAVTALSSELESAGIVDATQLPTLVPGLAIGVTQACFSAATAWYWHRLLRSRDRESGGPVHRRRLLQHFLLNVQK
jgi:hypothetical protein